MKSKLAILTALVTATATVTVTSGCAIRGNARGVAYAVDGAAIVGGAAIIADAQQDCDQRDAFEEPFCDLGEGIGSAIGTTVLIAGVIGLVTNMIINVKPSDESKKPSSAAVDFSAYNGPPGADTCGPAIAEWRAERNFRTKTIMYSNMTATCKARVTREDSRFGP